MVQILIASPAEPAVRELIDELDAYLGDLYPAESNHLDSVEELAGDHVFFVAAVETGQYVGCGAVKRMAEGYGEIKQVYVRPSARGRGISRRIMAVLESHLLENGIFYARLETGIAQPEARALYEKLGYRRIGPFGAYREDPLSLFMEKRLER